MRILILTLGTRGDLELFLLLARTMQARGHSVHVITSAFHSQRVLANGIECSPIGSVSQSGLDTYLSKLGAEPDLLKRTRNYVESFLRPELAAADQALRTMAATSDYFVSNLKITVARNGIVLPTAFVTYDPPASLDELDRYTAVLPRERILELVAFPKALLDPANRWPPRFLFTGFWLAEKSQERLPDDVEQFLSTGTPPVVLTTGSMRMFEPVRLANLFAEALKASDMRGVLINAPDRKVTDTLFCTGEVPYAALFRRAAAIVHHGGVGTTAEVLRAGKPSVMLPQILAQKHMAEFLSKAGVCAGAFDPATVSAATLAAAIREAVHRPGFTDAAGRIGEVIDREAGVDAAANQIERHWRTIASV